ncbi:hypothetical protein DDD_2380 [Nonlabens dokdonensis DSW-6]|uniref:Uncharacterized protein n=1 Tax=Nonlabens dokdonensis (strain DSM 17205 / KCTC 12402 / DSW-6) TaxID=592029 RepID=L7WBC3_NONDD|nr:hypothetical protein DDD_2380 [Nonlabens dokdonensis DSW-6]
MKFSNGCVTIAFFDVIFYKIYRFRESGITIIQVFVHKNYNL